MNKQLFSAKNILCMVLILLYAAGMLCLMFNAVDVGMLLWTVSLLGSIAVLYINHVKRKQAEDSEKTPEDDNKCE